MATVALFKTSSNSNSCGCYEKATSLEDIDVKRYELPDSPSIPERSISPAPGGNVFATVTRQLRSLMSIVQTMRCTGNGNRSDQEMNGSRSYQGSYIQKRNTSAPRFGSRLDTSISGHVEPTRESPLDNYEPQPGMNLPQNDTHTIAPSTNMAYKSSVLFNEETLRFADTFLPSMEPLHIWGISTRADDSDQPPTTSWVRRHTSIRPGNVIQIPSASNKGGIYLVSGRAESEWRPNAHLNAEYMRGHSQKMFIARTDGGAEELAGCSRAFVREGGGSVGGSGHRSQPLELRKPNPGCPNWFPQRETVAEIVWPHLIEPPAHVREPGSRN